MAILPQPAIPPEAQIKASAAIQREGQQRSDRDETLALDVLREAVKARTGQPTTARELADYSEVLWQWVTTNTWPPA